MANITMKRGDTWPRSLTIQQADGTAYDLTGATVWFTIKGASDHADDDDNALVKLYWISSGASDGITVADPETGVLAIEIAHALTDDLVVGRSYVYDVQVLNAGRVDTPVSGSVTIERDTTRRLTTP